VYDYNLLIYNVRILRRRWGRWRSASCVAEGRAGGGAEKLFYWLGNTGVTCMLVGL
jgi:hypothetical protein